MWTFEQKWDYKYQAMRFYQSGLPMELDIFIPHLRIAIEYQGEQHFMAIECWGGQEALEKTKVRDQEKREMCKVHHIDLIEFDYTWRGEKDVVIDAIRSVLKARDAARPEYKMIGSGKYKLFLPVRLPKPLPTVPAASPTEGAN